MGMFPKLVGFPPKSSILLGFSIINHPFWGTPIFGNTHGNLKGWRGVKNHDFFCYNPPEDEKMVPLKSDHLTRKVSLSNHHF